MNIRIAKSIDAPAILKITQQAWIEQYANPMLGLSTEDIENLGITKQDNIKKQKTMLDRISPRRIVLVATDDEEKVTGYILLVKREEIGWYLKSIYVLSACRSSGIGANLLSKAIEQLREKEPSAHSVTLDVVEMNTRAIEFYMRYGWVKRGSDIFTVGMKRLPTVTMTKKI